MRRPAFVVSWLAAAVIVAASPTIDAHDVERTLVSLTFSRDGSFVLDVANDPDWLKLRLERFSGPFSDRVVLWVDGHEVRPTSVEYIRPRDVSGLAVYRMRGRMPLDAKTLRWYYGLVIDPYPMAVRRADNRVIVEQIAGDAWSGAIDLRDQFTETRVTSTAATAVVAGVLLVPVGLRLLRRR